MYAYICISAKHIMCYVRRVGKKKTKQRKTKRQQFEVYRHLTALKQIHNSNELYLRALHIIYIYIVCRSNTIN